MPSAGVSGGQKPYGSAVRDGPVGVLGGSGVLIGLRLLPHVLQAHDEGYGVHGTVSELCRDIVEAGKVDDVEPLPLRWPVGRRLSAQQGAHDQAVLRWRRGGWRCGRSAPTGWWWWWRRKQVRRGRPKEPEEAPAKDVRRGPRPGRSGTDAGQSGLPAGPSSPVHRASGRWR